MIPKLNQNDMESIMDKLRCGLITPDEANVEMVRAQRVRLVTSRVPAEVRRALNAAVKRGELGHMKKAAHKPEAYYHPTFDYLAKAARNAHEREVIRSLSGVMCGGRDA